MLARIHFRGQFLSLSTLTKRFSSTTSNVATDAEVKKSTATTEKKKRWPLPPTNEERLKQMREDFFRREAEWEAMVDFSKLSDDDKVIHQCHKEAAEGNITSFGWRGGSLQAIDRGAKWAL